MRPWLLATLATTLLATGGLALWPAETPDDLLPPDRPTRLTNARPAPPAPARQALPEPAPSAVSAAASAAAPTAAQLPTRPADWPEAPAAALAAWQGPPAPPPPAPVVRPVAAAVAPSPADPVFPYRWIGQLDDGGAPQVLLASAQRSVAVRLGATLDNRWRLLQGPGGVLQAQALPDGPALAVPGAPPAALP